MKRPIYQVDAFASRVFSGNPAAVCPLEAWLDDAVLQSIALENNLSETAFFVPGEGGFHLRWFTPVDEVDLCGHATLASAFVIFNVLKYDQPSVAFSSRSGKLTVTQHDGLLTMNFPSKPPQPCDGSEAIAEGLGKRPEAVLSDGDDFLAVFLFERDILDIQPDMGKLKKLAGRGVIITAPGNNADFVSRFFAPKLGVDEDPVTGSTHCLLTPYWAGKLDRSRLKAQQLSKRGGELICELQGDRVSISGGAVLYLEGQITI
ncbi:MAG: PhzF family phenazine biosynthesis protein [Deferribacteres bacterium]|nr:PhzF family phenazine biosynthesis protein [candidate division KSB1 bacterium]MCB9511550.1 PhzF family phenazine biosynthesis protein [Deferribacteres bacterium]